MYSEGLLRTASNADIDAEELAKKAETTGNTAFTSNLAAEINQKWEQAKGAKIEIEQRLLRSYRQRKSEYDPEDLSIIREQGGSEVFMSITSVKCRTIEAALKDILIPESEKAWGIKPTPIPNLKEDVEEMARAVVEKEIAEMEAQAPEQLAGLTSEAIKERIEQLAFEFTERTRKDAAEKTERQETYLEDIMVQGDFEQAKRLFIKDMATYPAAFLKGPIIRKRTELAWQEQEDGQAFPVPVEGLKREFVRVSPFNIYPSPGSTSLDDGYLIERVKLRRKDLLACVGAPGFKTPAIMAVLAEYGEGGLKNWLWTDQEMSTLQDRPQENLDSAAIIEAILFMGDISGKTLLEWGMDKKEIEKPNAEYSVSAWLIGRWVVCLRFNVHPLSKRGYYSASFEENNDSIWGVSPPEIIRDCQKLCNNSARAIANNQNIASGPQVEVHKDRIEPGEDIENIYPWKIWRTKSDEQGHGRQAVYFYQPNPMTDSLMRTYEFFVRQAGDQLGIPAFEHGSTETKGAGETARGLQMLMQASSKIIKNAVRNTDKGIIEPCVAETWLHLVLTDENMPDCGDIKIVAKASEYIIAMEQIQLLRRDWLAITNNPTDMAIIGIRGRAEVLRETAKLLKMDVDSIIPGAEQVQQIEQAQQEAAAKEEQQQEEEHNANISG